MLTTLLYFFVLQSNNLLVFNLNFNEFKNLLRFTLPVGLQEICFPLYSFSLNYLIIMLLGNDYLGVYSAAISFYIMFLFVPGILRNVILKHFSSKENSTITKQAIILRQSILINLALTIIPIILFVFSYKYIIYFLGDSYSDIQLLILPMSIMAIISSISNPLYQYYIANDKNWKLFLFRLSRDILTILLVYIVINYSFVSRLNSLTAIMLLSAFTSAILFLLMFSEKNND